jgi:hypothetical protein
MRYTTLKIYCDQTNSNITTQFPTEHLLILKIFYKRAIWLPLVTRQTSRRFNVIVIVMIIVMVIVMIM